MATRSPASLAHPPDVGSGSAWASKEDHLADLHRRLSEALDRADLFSAYVDPRLVVELRDLLGEVLEVTEEQPGCRYGCRATPFHCPVTDPLEKAMAQLQASGWFPCWDAVHDQAARESVCLCGTSMTFQALCADGGQAIAWALCTFCGHWRPITPSDQA
jgi:hypothetical protein